MTKPDSASGPLRQGDRDATHDANLAFALGNDLLRAIRGRLATLAPTTEDRLWTHVFSLSLFAKSSKTYQAIQQLWRSGFLEDALALSRTLFEIDLILGRLAASPEETTANLVQTWQLERAIARVGFPSDGDMGGAYASLVSSGDVRQLAWVKRKLNLEIVGPSDRQEEVERLNKDLDHIAKEMNFYERGALGRSIWTLAKESGQKQVSFYRTWYRLLSCLIHSHPLTYDWYQAESEGRVEFLFDPDPRLARRPEGTIVPLVATDLILGVTTGLDCVLHLQEKSAIEGAREALKALVASPTR